MATLLGDLVWRIIGDTRNFDKDIDKTESKLDKFSKRANKIGNSLTLSLTLPIAALGGAAVKAAADFEVIERKFNTAFKGAAENAAASVKLLNDEFGLSNSQAKQLLANTGDLLKGFGATANQALDTSTEVQKLASSLAAYNGVPVKQASQAITKALLGERESLKELGVVIREVDVEKQLLADGTAELTGQELLLAKAQATLKLAYSQSGDAVASFADNQDTVAFQTQKVKGQLQDLAVQFGEILLPIVSDALAVISNLIKQFSELDEGTKRTIVTLAGLAAGIGPVIKIVGRVAKTVGTLSKAFKALKLAGLGPLGIIVGITAAGAGLIKVLDKQIEKTKRAQELQAKLDSDYAGTVNRLIELRDATERTASEQEEYDRLVQTLEENLPGFTDEVLNNNTALLEQALLLAKTNKRFRELSLTKKQQEYENLKKSIDETTLAQQEATKEARIFESLEIQFGGITAFADEANGGIEAAREWVATLPDAETALQDFDNAVADANRLLGETNQEYQRTVGALRVYEEEIAEAKAQVENYDSSIKELTADLKLAKEEQAANTEEAKAAAQAQAEIDAATTERREKRREDRKKFNEDIIKETQKRTLSELELLELDRQAKVAKAEELRADVAAVNALYDIKRDEILDAQAEEDERRAQEVIDRKLELVAEENQKTLDAIQERIDKRKEEEQLAIQNAQEIAGTVEQYLQPALSAVGEALVLGGDAWNDLGILALNTIASVLDALGKELVALAAVNAATGNAPGAVAAGAGAAAAFVAAGAVRGFAQKQSEQVNNTPAAPKPTGSPRTVSPDAPTSASRSTGMSGDIVINNTFSFGTEAEAREAARKIFPYLEEERRRRG